MQGVAVVFGPSSQIYYNNSIFCIRVVYLVPVMYRPNLPTGEGKRSNVCIAPHKIHNRAYYHMNCNLNRVVATKKITNPIVLVHTYITRLKT